MKITVVNKKWSVIVLSDKTMAKRHPKTHAVAILEDRKIYVRKSSLNKETIIHELIHAYQHELSFHELQLDEDQVDEWFAELFAKYGERMIESAKRAVPYRTKLKSA